jgi:hypothetical protein
MGSGLNEQMHFHTRTSINLPETGDEYEVKRFMDHREVNGKMQFLTKWKGIESMTWEPVERFVTAYETELVKSCREKKIALDMTKYLHAEPSVRRANTPVEIEH